MSNPLDEAISNRMSRILREHTKMQALLVEFLNDQEGLREPYRNEAICEKARAMLEEIAR